MCGTPAGGRVPPTVEPRGAVHDGSTKAVAGVITKGAGETTVTTAMDTPTDITNRPVA